MKFGKVLSVVAASALTLAPVVAQAGTNTKSAAASNVKRVGAVKKSESKLGGGNGTIVALVAAAAVIVGIVIAADGSSSK